MALSVQFEEESNFFLFDLLLIARIDDFLSMWVASQIKLVSKSAFNLIVRDTYHPINEL